MAPGASFRDMTADDVPAGLALSGEAGWNQTEDDWRVLLAPPSVFRAAVLGGRVVGSAGALVYGDRLAWVCMVLVSPVARGAGLGTRLVEQVLERVPHVRAIGLDATPQGLPVYERLGFAETARLARLAAASGAPEIGPGGDARPMTEADLPRVLLRDREALGADRERVLRHAFGSAPGYAWCVAERGAIAAYSLGRHGTHAEQIGPIVADSVSGASAVLSACLHAHPGRRFFVDAPAWPEWRAVLGGFGFSEQRPFTRMYRLGLMPQARPEQVYAAFGPELG